MQLGAFLGRLAGALGLTLDRRGLVRTGALLAVLLGVYAAAFPERPERLLRHLFGWFGTGAFLFLWWRGAQQIHALEMRQEVPWRLLVGFFVVFAALATAIRPFHSSDVYAYVTVGQLQHAYDLDPYVHTAADVEDWEADPLLSGTWKDVPCTYGVLFAFVTKKVVQLGGDLASSILLFKLLGIVVLAACAWLTLDTMRRLGVGGRALALFTLLWSPYVLLHFVSNAHNDLWMALFLLVAFRQLLLGDWPRVVAVILLAALIKHLALVALPFAWILLVRRHGWWRTAVSSAAAFAVVAALLVAWSPPWSDVRWAQIGSILTTPWNSFQAAITYSYAQVAQAVAGLAGSEQAVTTIVRIAFGLGFLGFYAWRWLRAVRRSDYAASDVIEDAVIVFFVLLCIASAAWHPWYLGMYLPAIFLLPCRHPIRELTLWIAAFQMLAFTPLAKARVLEALVMLALPMLLYWRMARASRRARSSSDARTDGAL
ncbi:MAG: hypothetical protein QNJ90_07155 [Planctomycetota bacterium]|nr:hypothetical protein [Planctomycetota bacterium]